MKNACVELFVACAVLGFKGSYNIAAEPFLEPVTVTMYGVLF